MAEAQIIQNAFNAGELSPTLVGRGDIPAYKAGLRRCENWIVQRAGGLERRPGSRFVQALADETKRPFLWHFVFSETTSFILEFTANQLRFYKDREIINYATHIITGGNAAQVLSDEFIVPNHGYQNDLAIRFTATGGSTLPTGIVAGTDYTVSRPPTLTGIPQATGVSTAGNSITSSLHTLTDAMGPFRFTSTSTLPTGISADTDYFVRNPTANSFQVSLTASGAIVNITATGSGFLSMTPTAKYSRDTFRVKLMGALIVLSDSGIGSFTLAPPTDVPLLLPTPFTEAQLPHLQFAQEKDLVVIATDGTARLQVLRRYADAAWEITDADLLDGPYLDPQTVSGTQSDTEITAAVSAATGQNVVLTMSAPIFVRGDIGRLVRLGNPAIQEENAWGWGEIVGIGEPTFTDVDFSDDTPSAVDAALETLTVAAHLFTTGEGPVHSDISALGLTAGTDYFIHVVDPDTISIHLTAAAAVADTGRVNITAGAPTLVLTSSSILKTDHGFSDNDGPVQITTTGVLTTGFNLLFDYFIRVIDKDRFGFSLTSGGALIAPTLAADGSGTHTINGATLLLTQAFVDVKTTFPALAAGTEWKLGAFADRSDVGHPQACTFHEQRLILGGAPGAPQTVHGSSTGQIFNFQPDEQDRSGATFVDFDRIVTDASGYSFTLRSDDLNAITWLRSVRALLAGTVGGIFAVTATAFGEAITPTNVNARLGTEQGGASISPAVLGTFLSFVESSGSVLSQAEFRPDTDSIETKDLMDLAAHLGEGFQILQIAITENPIPAFWVVRSDGVLLCLTFDPTQNVGAWSRQLLGGTGTEVESVAILPSALGGEVWLAVKRTINGVTHRYIEVLGDRFHEQKLQEDAEFTDSSILYTGVSTSTIIGLDHLEGETVEILADGARTLPKVVVGGQITLDDAAVKVRVGLGYRSIIDHMPPEVDARRGAPVVSLSNHRIVQGVIRCNRTLGLKAGPDESTLQLFDFRNLLDPMDLPPTLFTGILELVLNSRTDRDQSWVIVADGPHPAQILSTYTRVEFSNR